MKYFRVKNVAEYKFVLLIIQSKYLLTVLLLILKYFAALVIFVTSLMHVIIYII